MWDLWLRSGTETGFSPSFYVSPVDIVPPLFSILIYQEGPQFRDTVSHHRHEQGEISYSLTPHIWLNVGPELCVILTLHRPHGAGFLTSRWLLSWTIHSPPFIESIWFIHCMLTRSCFRPHAETHESSLHPQTPSTTWSPKWSWPNLIFRLKCWRHFSLPHTCYMSRTNVHHELLFCEGYKLLSSSLCNFFNFLLPAPTLIQILSPAPCSCLWVKDTPHERNKLYGFKISD
jgi:hypothetical protein